MGTGIIYGAQSGQVRRVITAANSNNFIGHIGQGEALLLWDDIPPELKSGTVEEAAKRAIEQIIGKPTESAASAVVDESGIVQSIALVDPNIDQPPDGMAFVEIKPTDVMSVGDVYDENAETFVSTRPDEPIVTRPDVGTIE